MVFQLFDVSHPGTRAAILETDTAKYISSNRDIDIGNIYNRHYMPGHIYIQLQFHNLLLDRPIYFDTHSHFLQRGMLRPKRLYYAVKHRGADDNDDLHDCDNVPCNIYV